jgi:hypothetical protein
MTPLPPQQNVSENYADIYFTRTFRILINPFFRFLFLSWAGSESWKWQINYRKTLAKFFKSKLFILYPWCSSRNNITINVPVLYMARDVLILMGVNPSRGPLEGPTPSNGASKACQYGVRSPKCIWAPCTQLYSLVETPHPPRSWAHIRGRYCLLVSQDRRHLFVSPWLTLFLCELSVH